MATHTSDEYKASLLALLQRSFSANGSLVLKFDADGFPTEVAENVVRSVEGRVYYNQKFHEIFYNDSVTVTPEGYADFVEQMNADLDHCSRKGYRTLKNFYDREGTDSELVVILQQSFAAIGITMEFGKTVSGDTEHDRGDLNFTLPDGTLVQVWFGYYSRDIDYVSYLYINCNMYTNMDYVGIIAPTYAEAELK